MSLYMINTRDLILRLKSVKTKRGLSLDRILILMESKGKFVSKSTLSRVFRNGSEECSFSYEGTLRPLASVLLEDDAICTEVSGKIDDHENLLKESGLSIEYQRSNSLLINRVEVMKEEMYELLSEERAEHEREKADLKNEIAYLKKQIEVKDNHFNKLFDLYTGLLKSNMLVYDIFLGKER